jgi:tubulin monoglycylase TTLL3/8
MDNLEKIIDHVNKHQENKYLVQKYVEKPFLIHNTKFDIRQYFLTLILRDSVEIWIYK